MREEPESDPKEIFDLLCRRLQEGPDVLIDGLTMTVPQVLGRVVKMMRLGHFCCCALLKIINVARMAFLKRRKFGEVGYIRDLTRLGLAAMETLCRVYLDRGFLCDSGRDIAITAAACVSLWRPSVGQEFEPNYVSSHWAAFMLCDCVHGWPSLSAEMLRLVAMIKLENIMKQSYLGNTITQGIIRIPLFIRVEMLLPLDKPGLLWSLRRVLHHMHLAGYLQPTVHACYEQVECLTLGAEAVCLAQFALLMREAAKRLTWLQAEGFLTSGAAVRQYLYIIHILDVLFASPLFQQVFELPGLAQIAASTIVVTCRHIFTMELRDVRHERYKFKMLLNDVDVFFENLRDFQATGGLVTELKRYHARSLSFFVLMMKKWRGHTCRIPVPEAEVAEEDAKECPQRFIDQVTGRIMKDPVFVPSTGKLVDRSTFICMVLAAEPDPITFMPVEVDFRQDADLKEEIRKWKANAKAMKRGSDKWTNAENSTRRNLKEKVELPLNEAENGDEERRENSEKERGR